MIGHACGLYLSSSCYPPFPFIVQAEMTIIRPFFLHPMVFSIQNNSGMTFDVTVVFL
jgi:hypothetical protein